MRLKNTIHPPTHACSAVSGHSTARAMCYSDFIPWWGCFGTYIHMADSSNCEKKWSTLFFFPPYKQIHCECRKPWGFHALTWDRNGSSAKCVTPLTPHTQECLKRVTFDLKTKCYILFPLPFTVATVKCQSVCDLPTGAKRAIQRVLQTFAHQLWVCKETSDMRFLRESLYAVIFGDCWLLPGQTFTPHIPNAEKVPTLGSA